MGSTNIPTGGLVTFSVKINGSSIEDTTQVFSIEVEKEINKISRATITIKDGDAADGSFKQSSSSTFVPGNKVTIEAGYDSTNKTIFEGIITNQNIRINKGIGPVLEVLCRDAAIKMTVGKETEVFSKMKDSDIMSSLINNYSGITSDVAPTQNKWSRLVQYYTTDWDFLISRAQKNGMLVTAINNKVSVFKPDFDTSPICKIEYGNNLLSFNGDLNSINQISEITASSWDFKTQKIIQSNAPNNTSGPGNLSSKKLSDVVGLSEYKLQTTAPIEVPDLSVWARSVMTWSEFSKINGEAEFQGTNSVDPGKYITLGGLGDRFNGDHFVSGVTHTLEDGNWITRVNVGLNEEYLTNVSDAGTNSNADLISGIHGLFNGKVIKMYEDPDNQYRILVDVPLFNNSEEGVWARLSTFYATSGAGAFFMPEVGDEVIVGFLNQDPRYPVILGSVYSSTNNRPSSNLNPSEKNPKKAFVSKSGIQIEFDDENKVLSIMTPSNNQIVMSDEDKTISIKDQNSNSITMSESGITMKSPKSINIEATEKLTLKGNTGVVIESLAGDISEQALNIKHKANMSYSAQGSAQAELKGGAQTSIKGAMVMIN